MDRIEISPEATPTKALVIQAIAKTVQRTYPNCQDSFVAHQVELLIKGDKPTNIIMVLCQQIMIDAEILVKKVDGEVL
jgi:hypothetical protein